MARLLLDLTVAAGDPEIRVVGAMAEIVDGDSMPSLTDGTDFGSVEVHGGSVTQTFQIENVGTGFLSLGSVLSSNPAFAVTMQPSGRIAASASSQFTVVFDPQAAGAATATLQIPNNDE